MKRFYCVECNRVIRSRSFPDSVESPFAQHPIDRIGICNFHNSLQSRNEVNSRISKKTPPKVKFATPVNSGNTKKGRK